MPKNEDGEFELILANRQLLSVFFIVVVLLGVFFTMGYIVGSEFRSCADGCRLGAQDRIEASGGRFHPSAGHAGARQHASSLHARAYLYAGAAAAAGRKTRAQGRSASETGAPRQEDVQER